MEFCDICGNAVPIYWDAGKHKVCEECKPKLNDYIANKCLNCGSYGFIPITKENINKLMYFLPMNETELCHADLVIVWADCPQCGGKDRLRQVISTSLRS